MATKTTVAIGLTVALLSLGVLGLMVAYTPTSAAVMYANAYTEGDTVLVTCGGNPQDGTTAARSTHLARLDPDNALGTYDCTGSAADQTKFFAVGAREWVDYTFADEYWNIEGYPDIEFNEVTWSSGLSWNVEAIAVYLTGAYVVNAEGAIVGYGATDDGIGYFAGIAWNRIAIQYVSTSTLLGVTQSYYSGTRDFEDNEFYYQNTAGNTIGWTKFYLPDEVVYATGITVVDITGDAIYDSSGIVVNHIYNLAGSGGYYNGNTDGYDLDAMRVFKYEPWRTDDTATGSGTPILSKGKWFMYNTYSVPTDASPVTYNIQAGNPADGTNIIGTYKVESLGSGYYKVTYDLDETITKNGYIYDIEVEDECLAISDSMDFTANPGQDDDQDFGVSFYDADGTFYIYAHLSVDYI